MLQKHGGPPGVIHSETPKLQPISGFSPGNDLELKNCRWTPPVRCIEYMMCVNKGQLPLVQLPGLSFFLYKLDVLELYHPFGVTYRLIHLINYNHITPSGFLHS